MIKRASLLAILLTFVSVPASAQLEDLDVVDRLVAIVGDSVVVMTQIQEEIQRMALGGAPVPDPGTPEYQTLARGVLDQIVNQLLVLQAASRDSLIEVDEADLGERVNERISQLTQQFGGQAGLQRALASEALSLAEYREILTNEARKEQVQQMYLQLQARDAAPLPVTEEELLERFQEARGQLQQRPKLVSIEQVVIAPKPSEASVEAARTSAESLLERIRAGEDFAALAEEFSEDPGSAQLGGDLGWFRRGRMVREFEDVAFSLFIGQVSAPVRTDYGFHLIKLERIRTGERQARHILIMPDVGDQDVERARMQAQEVLQLARGGASMSELFTEYSDPAAPDSLTLPFEQIAELPPVYGVLRTAATGDFLGPLEYESGPSERRFAVVRVREVREAGAYTFEDVRAQLAAQVQQEKQIERLLTDLRQRTYIEIRM